MFKQKKLFVVLLLLATSKSIIAYFGKKSVFLLFCQILELLENLHATSISDNVGGQNNNSSTPRPPEEASGGEAGVTYSIIKSTTNNGETDFKSDMAFFDPWKYLKLAGGDECTDQ